MPRSSTLKNRGARTPRPERANHTTASVQDYLAAIYDADVTALLPALRAPALVLHYRGDRVIPYAGGQQLAAGLPRGRLVTLPGRHHLPDARDLDQIVSAITDFLA